MSSDHFNSTVSANGQTPQRVVITGVGAVTPLGLSVDETWAGLLAGRSGIDYIDRFDPSELRTHFAGQVKNFDPQNYMDRKEARRLDLYIQNALAATKEAVGDSPLDLAVEAPHRVGCIIGSGIGGILSTLENQAPPQEKGLMRISPFMVPNLLVDSAAGKVAIEYNLHGVTHAVVSAGASGTAACAVATPMS